jgi:hypothetical protein
MMSGYERLRRREVYPGDHESDGSWRTATAQNPRASELTIAEGFGWLRMYRPYKSETVSRTSCCLLAVTIEGDLLWAMRSESGRTP